MNTRKKGVFGGVHPQTHLFFGNLVVHTFVDEYKMVEIDRAMIEDFHIELIQIYECNLTERL